MTRDSSAGVLHRAAGLTIHAPVLMPGLPAAAPGHTPDLYIHAGTPAPWQHLPADTIHQSGAADDRGRPIVEVGRSTHGFHFAYADGTEVWIDAAGTNIWCTWPGEATLDDTATYLTGPILGFALRLRGALALHASAVQAGPGALVLVGPHGAGKSTAAAALARRGCPVITDDVLHLRRSGRQWIAEPFASSIRLWPEGAALVLGSAASLPRITPTWDKRALNLHACGLTAAAAAVPVASILFLEEREDPPRGPRLDSLGLAEAVVRLATHSSASHLLDDDARAREFEAIGELVRRVPCTRAIASPNPEDFDAFIDLLLSAAPEPAVPDVR